VLVNAELQILQFRGPTSAYLEPPTGKASFDVLKMARQGLMLPLRAAINKAKKENKPVRRENLRINRNGDTQGVNIEVVPLKNLRERCYLILFEDADRVARARDVRASEQQSAPAKATRTVSAREESRRSAELERELAEMRDYLQSVLEQHDAANEELQASNEEVQSANEELQSINEELETSKEELESANEELTTVNEEMAGRNTELNRLNGDLVNLQSSTKLAILLLGRDLAIRRFSAQAERQFNLLATDIGRPLSRVRHSLDMTDLDDIVEDVITNVRESEHEVRDKDGHWYSLRVRPYLTLDNKVDGAVLVLVDINALKRTERLIAESREAMRESEERYRMLFDLGPVAIYTCDALGVIQQFNRRAANLWGREPVLGDTDERFCGSFKLFRPDGSFMPQEQCPMAEVVSGKISEARDAEVLIERPDGSRVTVVVNIRPLKNLRGEVTGAINCFYDITERKQAEETLQEVHAVLRDGGEVLVRFIRGAVGRETRLIEL
jgi:PAS domain-containing protein